ncbi:hypothetical protein [Paenibacillus sp. ISL-20]|uniref:hypothetical protein n=1 Tax=Paenibacillus sp. ISL-20 TaxID=2819163 RepID=UPI001BEA3035|nr:hypothetical protein [Paenibacillus sp. ISL-20]MBT2761888.1 hypothetical protein [Paenibacillus sp. ISL-20]
MSKRAAGVGMLLIAALLYSARYLTAGFFGSGVKSWDSNLFNAILQSVGDEPLLISRIALVVGIIYIVWSEIESILGKDKKQK